MNDQIGYYQNFVDKNKKSIEQINYFPNFITGPKIKYPSIKKKYNPFLVEHLNQNDDFKSQLKEFLQKNNSNSIEPIYYEMLIPKVDLYQQVPFYSSYLKLFCDGHMNNEDDLDDFKIFIVSLKNIMEEHKDKNYELFCNQMDELLGQCQYLDLMNYHEGLMDYCLLLFKQMSIQGESNGMIYSFTDFVKDTFKIHLYHFELQQLTGFMPEKILPEIHQRTIVIIYNTSFNQYENSNQKFAVLMSKQLLNKEEKINKIQSQKEIDFEIKLNEITQLNNNLFSFQQEFSKFIPQGECKFCQQSRNVVHYSEQQLCDQCFRKLEILSSK